MMIIFYAILFLLLTQGLWFGLAYFLKTDKFEHISFYVSLSFIYLGIFFLSKEPNLISFMVFAFVSLWSVWRSIYLIYRLIKKINEQSELNEQIEHNEYNEHNKQSQQSEFKLFFLPEFDPKRHWLFQTKQAIKLVSGILPLLVVLLFSDKGLSYAGLSNILMVFGSLIWASGFLIEILFVGQKIGLDKYADSDIWEKDGVWNFSKYKRTLADLSIWTGIILLTLSSL